MKLYKVYTSLGDHDGYFCQESGDIGIENYCPCEDDEIVEGYNPQRYMPSGIFQETCSGEEINSAQEEISNYTPPPLPPGYEDFLKNQEDSEA